MTVLDRGRCFNNADKRKNKGVVLSEGLRYLIVVIVALIVGISILVNDNRGQNTQPVSKVTVRTSEVSEIERLRAFLELQNGDGMKNGQAISQSYDPGRPDTWTGIEFVGDRVVSINWRDSSIGTLGGALDLSGFRSLKSYNAEVNMITELNFADCVSLELIECGGCELKRLDVTGCSGLRIVDCEYNLLKQLDLAGCNNLKTIKCNNNIISSLDTSVCAYLEELVCDENQLSNLDVSYKSNLIHLSCGRNQLISLDVCGCTNLAKLYCGDNAKETYGLPQVVYETWDGQMGGRGDYHREVYEMDDAKKARGYNQLSSLDVSDCTNLQVLWCEGNPIATLDTSNCSRLLELRCDNSAALNSDSSVDPYVPFFGIWYSASPEYSVAEGKIAKLADSGYSPCIIVTDEWSNLNSNRYYAVTAGKYSSKEEAQAELAGVQAVVSDAYIKYSGDYIG